MWPFRKKKLSSKLRETTRVALVQKLVQKSPYDCCDSPRITALDPTDKLGWCTFRCGECNACWEMDWGGWGRDKTAEAMLAPELKHSFPLYTEDYNNCSNCDLRLTCYPAEPCPNPSGDPLIKELQLLDWEHEEIMERLEEISQEKIALKERSNDN